jgi:hypothetical protein
MPCNEPTGYSAMLALAPQLHTFSRGMGLKPFEINTVYHYWRLHVRDERLILKLYKTIQEGLELPSGWGLRIEGNYLYIKHGVSGDGNYADKLAQTPMEAPLSLFELFYCITREFKLHDCSMGSSLKSHVLHTFHREYVDNCRRSITEKLGQMGYTMHVMVKGKGNAREFCMVYTHVSECSDAACNALKAKGCRHLPG